jgi:hypothetical protein
MFDRATMVVVLRIACPESRNIRGKQSAGRELLDRGLDYAAAGRQLGIPPGQAYLIAAGRPAKATPDWAARVAADRPMPDAAARRTAEPGCRTTTPSG